MVRDVNNSKIDITVIDSGVDTSVSDLSFFVHETLLISINKERFIEVKEDPAVHHIHGTVVSLIIRDLCPDIRIRSINILDQNLQSDGRILLFAIEHALENPPDILHMSLGTTHLRYWFALRSLVKKARCSGTTVIAAADNRGKRSYPAFLKGVTGVKLDPGLMDKKDFYYKAGFFYAPCNIEGIKGKNEIKYPIGGNSAAAAFISGQIANLLRGKRSLNVIDPSVALKCQGIKNFISEKETF